MQDFRSELSYFGPLLQLTSQITTTTNAALVMSANLRNHYRDNFGNPVFPTITNGNLQQLFHIWRNYGGRSDGDLPETSLVPKRK